MFYGNNRNQTRQMFFNAWQKHKDKLPREALDDIIIKIILMHQEYHPHLDQQNKLEDKDFTPEMGESNPFLHMGLHIAIHEQLSTNQPMGIQSVYEKLIEKYQDAHETEHKMMDCLAETLWEAQRNNAIPDINNYLEKIKRL